jgi:N-acetylmuramoyl-L-alanine amidase
MREINKIIVHCTATPEGRKVSVEEIDSWHKQRGWSQIGYHYVVQLDGTINPGRPITITGAHVKGHNKGSIGITYVGGVESERGEDGKWIAKDTRTEAQKDSLEYLVGYLCASYPGAEVYGHCDFSSKACPSYDAKSEYKSIQEKYV